MDADLVIVRKGGERFGEPDALKLLIVAVNPKHFELGGAHSHIGLQVLLERRQRYSFVHVNH